MKGHLSVKISHHIQHSSSGMERQVIQKSHPFQEESQGELKLSFFLKITVFPPVLSTMPPTKASASSDCSFHLRLFDITK